MKDIINQLVVQSGNGQMHNGKLYPHIGSRTQEDWQKFVELIVKEFIQVSTETADRFESTQPDVAYGIRRNINNVIHHFGGEQ